MSAPSSLHRTEESSQSRSQVRGRPAILLDAAPLGSMASLDGSGPYSPTASPLFCPRDVNAQPTLGTKSLPTSKPASRARSGLSAASSRSNRAAPSTATKPVPSLPPFTSSLSCSSAHGSLSAAPHHPFHRDDQDDASEFLLMRDNTNLEMPPAHPTGATTEEAMEPTSPMVVRQRTASSWSRSGPASRHASPPPRRAELATDSPDYADSLSSRSHRGQTTSAALAPTTEEAERSLPYASPTPPPRHAVVLTASAASSFVVPTEMAPTAVLDAPSVAVAEAETVRGSTMLVSAAQSDAFTSLFRLQRRALEGEEEEEVKDHALPLPHPVLHEEPVRGVESDEVKTDTTTLLPSDSLVLATHEQSAGGATHKTGSTPPPCAPSSAAVGLNAADDSLETHLYPLHPDPESHAGGHAGIAVDSFLDGASLSPLPRPLRPSQRALTAPQDPPLSTATAQALREAREQRAAAPSADRAHQHDDVDLADHGMEPTILERESVLTDAVARPKTSDIPSSTMATTEEAPKDSLHLVTAASSAIWLTDGAAPVCTDRRQGVRADDDDETNARPARPTTATEATTGSASEKLSLNSAQWIDSRDFGASAVFPKPTSTSPVPTRPTTNNADAEDDADREVTVEKDAMALENKHVSALRTNEEEEEESLPSCNGEDCRGESPVPATATATMDFTRRSDSALDTPSRRVSDDVRRLMEKAQEEVRRTRESLLSSLEKGRRSLQHTSEVALHDDEDSAHAKADESSLAQLSAHTTTTTTTTTTLMTTVSLSPLTPAPALVEAEEEEEEVATRLSVAPAPSRVLEFVPHARASATPAMSRFSTASALTPVRLSSTRRSFSWSVAELRTELASIADAILHRLRGYDRQDHGVLPMEMILRVTYTVMQQRHPARLPGLAETPSRGAGSRLLLAAAASSAHRVSHTQTPLTTRMCTAGVKRFSRLDRDGTAEAYDVSNKENIAPRSGSGCVEDVWWPASSSSAAHKRPRREPCLRETGSPESGEPVPYRTADSTRDEEDEGEAEEEEVVGRPATRISPSRTLEQLAAVQACRAEETLCMDLYTTLLSAFREVFGERYALKHLGATNATRHDAYYPLLSPRSQSPKKRVLQDLNDVSPPLETAFPRLRQQYAVRTRSHDGSGRHVCDPRHPPPLDMLVYYQVFVDSLRELAQS